MTQFTFPFMDPGNDAKMAQMMGMGPRDPGNSAKMARMLGMGVPASSIVPGGVTPSGQMLFPFMAGEPALDPPRRSAAVPLNPRAKPDPLQGMLPGMEDAYDLPEEKKKKKGKKGKKGKKAAKEAAEEAKSVLPKAARRGAFMRMLPGLGMLGLTAGYLLSEANRRRREDNARMSQMRMMAAMGTMNRFGQSVELGQQMGDANRINMAANILNSINIPNPADVELNALLGATGSRAAQAAALAPSTEERGMAFANALT